MQQSHAAVQKRMHEDWRLPSKPLVVYCMLALVCCLCFYHFVFHCYTLCVTAALAASLVPAGPPQTLQAKFLGQPAAAPSLSCSSAHRWHSCSCCCTSSHSR
jgi:hypothetical protein